jgi:hypothetical protein
MRKDEIAMEIRRKRFPQLMFRKIIVNEHCRLQKRKTKRKVGRNLIYPLQLQT